MYCLQHELLLRLGPVLDAPVHPRDCCGVLPTLKDALQNGHDASEASSSGMRPLPVSRRASSASHDNLKSFIDQVGTLGIPGRNIASNITLAFPQACNNQQAHLQLHNQQE